jgi:hypothetical protein
VPPTRPDAWALGSFAVFLAGGLVLGEVFPFSRYDMYADIAARDRGAVPVFRADGRTVEPTAFRAFHGLDPARFRSPEGVVCTMDYVVNERAAYVAARPADEPGPVRIVVGFDRVRVEDGHVVHELLVTDEGTAWP